MVLMIMMVMIDGELDDKFCFRPTASDTHLYYVPAFTEKDESE